MRSSPSPPPASRTGARSRGAGMNLVGKPGAPPQRRKRLSRREFAQLMLDQEGLCFACQEKLRADAIVDEHLVPLDQCGTNELSNRALLCRGCAREKTRSDQSASAHGRRVRGESGQRKRQQRRRKGELPQVIATNRSSRWKRKVDGSVVRRRQRRRYAARILYQRPPTPARRQRRLPPKHEEE